MNLRTIHFQSLIATSWSGGKTYQYCINPCDSNYNDKDFNYRISSATIELDESHFTQFKGYIRYLVMLDNSLKIKHNGITKSFNSHEIFTFDSNDDVISYSKGSDFNLMVAKQSVNTSIRIDSGLIEIKSRKTFLFALSSCTITIDNSEFHIDKKDLIILKNGISSFLLPTKFIVIEL